MVADKPVVGVVGVGLIGGSLGMCLANRAGCRVIGWDACSASLDTALKIGAVTDRAADLSELCTQSDVIFVATPISVSMELLPVILKTAPRGSIVTDVCSTKQGIVDLCSTIGCNGSLPVFIGGHPMAGSERAGIGAADPYLFENALYILTPPKSDWKNDERLSQAISKLSGLLEYTGARLAFLSPQEHDLMAAIVSHLPHVIAVALVKTLESYSRDYPQISSMVAGGFRDATRVAMGSPLLWTDILTSNASNVAKAIESFSRELAELSALIASDDRDTVTDNLQHAADLKRSLPQNLKGLAAPLYELVVAINDEPGKISGVTSLIAAAGINIKDIEILKIREGEGGTLRLGFADQTDCRAALSLLCSNGYRARER